MGLSNNNSINAIHKFTLNIEHLLFVSVKNQILFEWSAKTINTSCFWFVLVEHITLFKLKVEIANTNHNCLRHEWIPEGMEINIKNIFWPGPTAVFIPLKLIWL